MLTSDVLNMLKIYHGVGQLGPIAGRKPCCGAMEVRKF